MYIYTAVLTYIFRVVVFFSLFFSELNVSENEFDSTDKYFYDSLCV